jgi:MscS family membrane protein
MPKFFCTLSILLIFLSFKATGQEDAPLTMATPYHTMYAHLYYLQSDTYRPQLAAQVFPPAIDSTARRRAAIRLKQILDGSGLFVDLEAVPQDSNYIDSTTNRARYVPFPQQFPEIYLAKENNRWYYSNATFQTIPELHKKVFPLGADKILNLMPQSGQDRFLGLMAWQYLGILFMLLAAYLAHLLLSRLIIPLVNLLARTRFKNLQISKRNITKVARILSFFVVVKFAQTFLPVLQLPIRMAEFAVVGLKILSTIIVMLLALRVMRIIVDYLYILAERSTSKLDDQLIPIVTKLGNFIIVILAVFQVLSHMDVDITALIAGISIGGLALALAAQDTVKNLIGSFNIFVDKPFQIGDYVLGGDFEGTVEEVGFRTTRIRKIDSSIVAVPNSKISDLSINNLGLRQMRLLQATLGVTYDTPASLMELFIEGLKEVIRIHPKLDNERFYVVHSGFGGSSLNILFRSYVHTNDYGEELAVKEQVYLSIMRLAESLGLRFAFPSTTVYIEEFPEKKSLIPAYDTPQGDLQKQMRDYLNGFEERMKKDYGDMPDSSPEGD